ncbi:MAG: DUF1559 domain-containing protein [Planctomyces sp.]|nr:DUF1559 domain-containing protein [Planctomyces sp.]
MIILKRLIVGCICIGICILGYSGWKLWRHSESRNVCRTNLSLIGKGLHAYHDINGSFPSAYSGGSASHSWRVELLPWLNEQALHSQYDFGQSWDAVSNREVLPMRPAEYACPETADQTRTSYQAVVGIQTAWPYDQAATIMDITDGTSNTAMVLDVHSPDVEWTNPRDLSFSDALKSLRQGQAHHHPGTGVQVLFADGSVRYISTQVDPDVGKHLLTARSGAAIDQGPLSKEAAARASQEFHLETSASFASPVLVDSLPATSLSPFGDVKIPDGHSIVYCPTMSLAWRQYVSLIPQVALTDTARRLMENPFSEGDIAPNAVAIVAGNFGSDELLDLLQTRNNFVGADAGASKLEMFSETPPDGPTVWCGLRKQLAFIARFEAFSIPLTFNDGSNNHAVRAFGVTSHWDEWQHALSQMRVIDYRSPDDFVVQIGNLSGDDLILAKLPQPATLDAGMKDVETRIQESNLPLNAQSVVRNEQVVVPMLELSLLARFTDQLNHPDQPSGSRVQSAAQVVQFRLDEKGALLISETEVVGENGHIEHAVGTRTFILDKPFLIMLRESPSKNPYFAAWIGNTDLMVESN